MEDRSGRKGHQTELKDPELEELLRAPFGYTDKQLEKELEEAEKNVDQVDFSGAEERMFQKLMDRKNPKSRNETHGKTAGVSGLRAGRKLFRVVLVAAIFAGMLGIIAVGEKNYFFRETEKTGNITILDNDDNRLSASKLEEAYEAIEEELNIKAAKLNYIPKEMVYEGAVSGKYRATLEFDYNGYKIYFIQEEKESSSSVGSASDRGDAVETVFNKWMDLEIEVTANKLQQGQVEYEAAFSQGRCRYSLIGIIDLEEFIKIIENINIS